MSIDQASASAPAHPTARVSAGRGSTAHVGNSMAAIHGQASSFEQLLGALNLGSDSSADADSNLMASIPAAAGATDAEMDADGAVPTAMAQLQGTPPPTISWVAELEAAPLTVEVPATKSMPLPLAPSGTDATTQRTSEPADLLVRDKWSAPALPVASAAIRTPGPLTASLASFDPDTAAGLPAEPDGAVHAGVNPRIAGSVGASKTGLSSCGPASAVAALALESVSSPGGRVDLKDLAPQPVPERVVLAAGSGPELAASLGPRPLREYERRESSVGASGYTVVGQEGGVTTQGAGLTSYALAAPDAAVAADAVAQKLFYWVTGGVQNAELQVDAFGGGAVDVTVSVQGNEAMVEFRSDHPEARKLLNDAMPQLRAMLGEEGLMLSGGFVGTSARDGAQPSPRRHPDQREGAVSLPSIATQSSGARASTAGAGSRLDVFV